MPAVLPADGVGLHRKYQVLMHARIFPPYPLRVGILALERLDTVNLAHHPFSRRPLLEIDQCRRPSLTPGVLLEAPTPEMMRACDHSRPNSFRHPHLRSEEHTSELQSPCN